MASATTLAGMGRAADGGPSLGELAGAGGAEARARAEQEAGAKTEARARAENDTEAEEEEELREIIDEITVEDAREMCAEVSLPRRFWVPARTLANPIAR